MNLFGCCNHFSSVHDGLTSVDSSYLIIVFESGVMKAAQEGSSGNGSWIRMPLVTFLRKQGLGSGRVASRLELVYRTRGAPIQPQHQEFGEVSSEINRSTFLVFLPLHDTGNHNDSRGRRVSTLIHGRGLPSTATFFTTAWRCLKKPTLTSPWSWQRLYTRRLSTLGDII